MENVTNVADRVIRIGFGLLFILVPLILTPWNYELFEYNKMMVTYGLTAVIMGAWIVKMIGNNEIRIKKTPLDIPIVLFVLSQFISTIFSMDPHVSWFGYYSRFNGGMLSVLTYVALYYAFVSNFVSPPDHAREHGKWKMENGKNKNQFLFSKQPISIIYRLLQVILVTGLVVSLYGIAEHFGIDKNLWVQDVQNRVFSTLGQPNWLAAYLIALIPVSMGLGIMSFLRKQESKIPHQVRDDNSTHLSSVFYFLLSIIFFLTLLWTRSRSGFLALAAADIVFWGILLARSHLARQGETFRKLRGSFLLIHATFFLIVIINGTYIQQIDNWITIKAWQQRFGNIAIKQLNNKTIEQSASVIPATQSAVPLIDSGITDSGDIRKYVWEGAINIWKSSPKAFLIGTGTETYAFAFYRYKPLGHNLTSEWDFLYNKAHNEYLNFLATTGLLGLGTYLLLIGTFIYWFLSRNNSLQDAPVIPAKAGILKIPGQARDGILSIGLFSAWLSILITNFFGFSVVIMQLFFYLFPAFIFVLTPTDGWAAVSMNWQKKTRSILGISTALIATLLVCSIIISWFADKQFASGYHLSRAGYLPQAYQALTSAINLNPTEPFYHDEQGNVLSTLAVASWKENQATVSQELAQMSIRENDIALAISPKNVNFWKSRTKIFYALSTMDPELLKEAIKALEYAITLSPSDPKLYYNLAILYGQTDEASKSVDFMKKSIALKPNYREGYFGLSLLYTQLNMPEEARQIAESYLEKVDPSDQEFKALLLK